MQEHMVGHQSLELHSRRSAYVFITNKQRKTLDGDKVTRSCCSVYWYLHTLPGVFPYSALLDHSPLLQINYMGIGNIGYYIMS